MASTLSLFPSRIKIANQDGTMTPEFYRALQALFNRVGGSTGNATTDLIAEVYQQVDFSNGDC